MTVSLHKKPTGVPGLKSGSFEVRLSACADIRVNRGFGTQAILMSAKADNRTSKDLVFRLGRTRSSMTKILGHQLRDAAAIGDLAEVARLVQAGVSVNDLDDFNNTALLHAARRGKQGCVRFLIDSGADVNIANDTNYTPLFCAALHGDAEIVKMLLDAGAEQHHATKDEDGSVDTPPHTALFVAEHHHRHQAVELLKAAETRLRLPQKEDDEAARNIDGWPDISRLEQPL